MAKQSSSFIERIRANPPDRISTFVSAARAIRFGATAYWTWLTFSHDLSVRWLALFALAMAIAEMCIQTCYRERTNRVILIDATAFVLGIVGLTASFVIQVLPPN